MSNIFTTIVNILIRMKVAAWNFFDIADEALALSYQVHVEWHLVGDENFLPT